MRLLLVLIIFSSSATAGQSFRNIPVEYRHDRIFITVQAEDGSAVEFYTDSGGGYNAISESLAERLGLEAIGEVSVEKGKRPLVQFPQSFEDGGIPRPSIERWLNGGLVVAPESNLEADGFLGSRWFEGKVWLFDYQTESLSALERWEADTAYHTVSLGFRTGADGTRDLSFPRITVSIAGESFEMLLDTGATAKLTEEAALVYGLSVGTKVGISYISEPIFVKWAKNNPSWRVIENGENVTGSAFPMIEVDELTVAGVTVGPVWFAQRPEGTFEQWISQMTDEPVVGAVGGSLFRYFRMVLDYPMSRAYFQSFQE